MKKRNVKNVLLASVLAGCCGLMTACTSLQSQMRSYDNDIRTCIKEGEWNKADRIADNAQFNCEPYEERDVQDWRAREKLQIKSAFTQSLVKTIEEANSFYSKGDIEGGDNIRYGLLKTYFGGVKNEESEAAFSQMFGGGSAGDTGIPESLVPCLKLAYVNMLSDRNITRMCMAYEGFAKRIAQTDINGGKDAIKTFDAIEDGIIKVGKWKDKIDLFMQMLADPDTSRWAHTDRSTYARSIKKMEAVRNKVNTDYEVKRWNTRVVDRRRDYVEISKLTSAGKYNEAMQILSSHDWIIMPIGLEGVMEFDDQAERAKVASEGLGEAIVKQIFESGLQGVQYDRKDFHHNIFSVFIVGRAYVEDVSVRSKLYEAGRVAQMKAEAEFVRYLKTEIKARREYVRSKKGGVLSTNFMSSILDRAEAEVSNLTVLATGVDYEKSEVVFILGWRNPCLGMITPIPMRRVVGEKNFTITPSVGAYL